MPNAAKLKLSSLPGAHLPSVPGDCKLPRWNPRTLDSTGVLFWCKGGIPIQCPRNAESPEYLQTGIPHSAKCSEVETLIAAWCNIVSNHIKLEPPRDISANNLMPADCIRAITTGSSLLEGSLVNKLDACGTDHVLTAQLHLITFESSSHEGILANTLNACCSGHLDARAPCSVPSITT